jgi:hypothetical protein
MAAVWLCRRDCEEGALPPLCLKCGAPATHLVEQDFAGTLLGGSPLAFLTGAPHEQESTKLRVPTCARHRWYWRTCYLIILSACALALASIASCVVWLFLPPPREIAGLLPGGLSLAIVTLGLAYFGPAGIHAREVCGGYVNLAHVSLAFACAYEARIDADLLAVEGACDRSSRRPRGDSRAVTRGE